MSGSVKCHLWWDESVLAYRISCPYDRAFIDLLKAAIPASDRAYDPSTKIWVFQERWFDIIADTAKKIWSATEIVIITRAQAQAHPAVAAGRNGTLDACILDFVKLLPRDALLSAYRKAAASLHPDKGGSAESMAKLNVLWQRIENELLSK